MPDRAKEIFESFAYDGVLTWSTAVWVFLALAAFVGWMMWHERRVTGPLTASFFFLLRVAAIALVLWMLLGPSHVTTERTTIPHTLAVVVDDSQSMDAAEPLPGVERLRWQQAAGAEEAPYPELAQTDAAMAALRFAVGNLRQIAASADEYLPPDEARESFAVVKKAATRSQEHMAAAADILRGTDDELARRAADTADDLERKRLPALAELAAGWASSPPADSTAQALALLEDFQRSLRQAEAFERGVMARVNDSGSYVVDSANPPSRKALVAAALERLDSDVLSKLSAMVNIKRIRVAEFAVPLAVNESWATADAAPGSPDVARGAAERNREMHAAAGEGVTAAAADAGPATNLTAAIDLIKQDAAAESISAAVMFSDGGHNAPKGGEPQTAAAGLAGMPIHVVPVSSQEPQRDLVIYRVSAPTSVILHDKIVLEAIVSGQHLKGESAMIDLRRAGELVEQREIVFDGDRQDHRLQFSVPAEMLGQHVFDLVAEPLTDEASTTNNAAVAAVRVLRDTTNVLLADRAARWEYRYLDQLYRRDKHVKCDKFLCQPTMVATGLLEGAKELPVDVEGWARYDVAILGDLEPDLLDTPQQAALEEWVRKRGGTAIIIAGTDYMPHAYRRGPLTELLPVQESPRATSERDGYAPVLTPEGTRHEALMLADTQTANADMWSRQFQSVPMHFISSFCAPKPAAHVLLEAVPAGQYVSSTGEDDRSVDRVFLAWQDVGAGRVVYLSSPATYHLRFRRGDELHHRFWGQMLRWLTAADRGKGGSQLLVKTTESQYEIGKPVEVMAILSNVDGSPIKGADLAAVAESPTGTPLSVPLAPDESVPGRYFGKFDDLPPGAYRITAAGEAIEALAADRLSDEQATALVTIIAPGNIEMSDTRGNRTLLREISEVTGGQVLAPTAVGEILQLSAMAPRTIEDSTRTPLWNRWRYFWIVVGCLATEWIVRRRIGLV